MNIKSLINKRVFLLTGTAVVVLGCCLSVPIRESVIKVDRDYCYQRLAQDLGVPASHGEIRNELYSQLKNTLKPDMIRFEVIESLQQMYPISTIWKMTRLDGGVNEYIILEPCRFRRNNFPFLFIYSQDEVFEKVINHIDDSP